ncbi:MAG: TonB-dependent receptor [Gemmatimonadetes bacterium]|nr:TonB-dependent receptor [Gemmatimonadota bacterium]
MQRAIDGDSLGGTLPAPPLGTSCGASAGCNVVPNAARVTGTTTALYVDHRRLLTSWLQLGVGLRGVIAPDLRDGSRAALLPRLALEATPTRAAAVRVGVGSFSRAATLFDEANGATVLPATGLAGVNGAEGAWMSQSTATQLEVGASQRWAHTLVGVVAYWQRPQLTGVGQSALRHRGMDATWQYARGVTSLTASYSRVAREIRSWDVDSAAELLTSRLEQVASLGAATRVWKLHGALSASYAHGLSFASVVLERPSRANASGTPGDLANGGATSAPPAIPPQRSFLRVDASLSGRMCVAGPACRLVLAPYARVLNALDRRDAIFFYRDSPVRNVNRLGWVPALLSLGVRVDVARVSVSGNARLTRHRAPCGVARLEPRRGTMRRPAGTGGSAESM